MTNVREVDTFMKAFGSKKKKTFNISIIVDGFDDIFSDFDPREINQKALSLDFISELKQRYDEKNGIVDQVVIMIPKTAKNVSIGRIAIERIKEGFEAKEERMYKNILSLRWQGISFIVFGMIIVASSVFIPSLGAMPKWAEIAMEVLLPFGWFGMWEGFGKIVDYPKSLKESELLYWKLSQVPYKIEYYNK